MRNNIRVAFDCDGTLVDLTLSELPRYDMVAFFLTLENLGCQMFVWSRGGIEHATKTMQKCGLQASIVEKGSFKPEIAVDDAEHDLGIVNLPA